MNALNLDFIERSKGDTKMVRINEGEAESNPQSRSNSLTSLLAASSEDSAEADDVLETRNPSKRQGQKSPQHKLAPDRLKVGKGDMTKL